MHNGELGGFARMRRALLNVLSDEAFEAIQGSTDSEHLFAVWLDCMRRVVPGDGARGMAEALREAFACVLRLVNEHGDGQPSYLNVAVSDGSSAVAARFASVPSEAPATLYLSRGRRYVCESGVCRMLEPEPGDAAVLVASEPLGDDSSWEAVPANRLVLIHADRTVELQSL